MPITQVLDSRIIVCTGAGGVGKTSVSAALALEAACRGRKTIVLTIDPAKRLANALGLKSISVNPRRVPASHFRKAGIRPAPLDAMMLDTKTAFDDLIYRYAKDRRRAEQILSNRFYQAVSSAMSGTHEYMAMEKLYELNFEGKYDLIVIDTPPTRNALDFIDAPKRMSSFLDGRMLKWFLLPAMGSGKGLFRLANLAAVSFLKATRKVIGAEALDETAEFFASFEGLYEGFKQRAQAVYELLRMKTTSFVIVTSPSDQPVQEALYFAATLKSYRLPFKGLVVNRIFPHFSIPRLPRSSPELVLALAAAGERLNNVRSGEEAGLKRLKSQIQGRSWASIPYMVEEIADLSALKKMAGHMVNSA